jgi:2-amino-4-hydroxy-6-hydroxymethyldihydropteridine diphosphokinase
MTAAAIALGSNLGNRLEHLRAGVAAIAGLPDTRVVAISSIVETPALVAPGAEPGPDFLNAVVLAETGLEPLELLIHLLAAEREQGRNRGATGAGGGRWAARTLDLDLVFYGDRVIDEPGPPVRLRVPHPEMPRRRFVLVPLAQVAPRWVHPVLGRDVVGLLKDLACLAEPGRA